MNNRRSFLGHLLGFAGVTVLTGNEIVPVQQSKKLRFLNVCHHAFNCKEDELLKYSMFIYGKNFTMPCPRIRRVERDLEKLVCVFYAPGLPIRRTMIVQGLGVCDHNGVEFVRNNYCSDVPVIFGDSLINTYTLAS